MLRALDVDCPAWVFNCGNDTDTVILQGLVYSGLAKRARLMFLSCTKTQSTSTPFNLRSFLASLISIRSSWCASGQSRKVKSPIPRLPNE